MNENELIVLKQNPIIEFSEIEAKGLEVEQRINELNLETIDATEGNRSIMKKMRSELNKELDAFESRRKMVHDLITKPYKEFTDSYDTHIKSRYTEASAALKEKISVVELSMLQRKKGDIEAYFNSAKGDVDFLSFDDVGLKIILSASDKKLQASIDLFVAHVTANLTAINGMDNAVRIESLYKTNLDFTLSISTVLADIEREEALKKQQEERAASAELAEKKRIEQKRIDDELEAKNRVIRKKHEADETERKRVIAVETAAKNKSLEAEQEAERLENESKRAAEDLILAEQETLRLASEKEEREKAEVAAKVIHTMNFKVSGTVSQLKQIKQLMERLGVTYE